MDMILISGAIIIILIAIIVYLIIRKEEKDSNSADKENADIVEPNIVGKTDYNEIYTLLKSEFGEIPILLPDAHYELATKESFKKFLESDNTDKYQYTGDPGMDCEDYAAVLQGNVSIPKWATIPIGTVWLKEPAHALNVFIDENLNVYFVEPQNDKLMKVGKKIEEDGWVPHIIWF